MFSLSNVEPRNSYGHQLCSSPVRYIMSFMRQAGSRRPSPKQFVFEIWEPTVHRPVVSGETNYRCFNLQNCRYQCSERPTFVPCHCPYSHVLLYHLQQHDEPHPSCSLESIEKPWRMPKAFVRGGGVRRRSSFRNEEAQLETRFAKLQMLDLSLVFASYEVRHH